MLGKKSNQYMIFGLPAVAAVMFVGGFFAYPNISQESSAEGNEVLDVGGVLSLEIYDKNGNLKTSYEKHNALTSVGRNALISCMTGNIPIAFDCSHMLTDLRLDTSEGLFIEDAVHSSIPDGCTLTSTATNPCSGWTSASTFDFIDLICTPSVDCPTTIRIGASNPTGTSFHTIGILGEEIVPGDRVVATITFDLP